MFRKIKAVVSALIAVSLVIAVGGYGFAELQPIIPQQMAYKTALITRGNLARDDTFGAELYFKSVANVTMPKNGKYVTGVMSGSYVHTGDFIAQFSVPDNSDALYEAKLNYELAEARYRSNVDSAKAALERAVTELDVKSAKAALEYITYTGKLSADAAQSAYEALLYAGESFELTAPCDGYVGNIAHSPSGEMYAGQSYCIIRQMDDIQIRVAPEPTVVNAVERVALLTIGSEVRIEPVRADAPSFKGTVISNTSVLGDSSTSPYAVIKFTELPEFLDYAEKFPAAIYDTKYRVVISRVDIEGVLLCPRAAVQRENTYRYVNVLSDGIPKKRYVLIGLSGSENVLIFGGVSEGDEVILP
ncbi:MAG: hypothetical protein LBC38_02345 [Oscillospiraceae bacterium]|jgi:multidrug efflux pump subunit AcrA (membrane-fusion protein)|nr:hypothetical protein [Oscillospiraceae bacterium]